jgi:hypothetical protein
MSKANLNKVVRMPVQQQRNNSSHTPTGRRKRRSRDQTKSFLISRELVADRLRCMLEHVHSGNANQVILHTIAVANVLKPVSPSDEAVRDLVQEAQGLFMRGNAGSAEQRLHGVLTLVVGSSNVSTPRKRNARRQRLRESKQKG